MVKSYFVNSNKNVYAGVLYVDFDLQPNTTYTMFFDGQDGNNYYINENLFKNYTVVKVGAERTVVHLTTKDTDISGSYTDGMGWLILKNDKNQTNDHVFDNIYIVEGDSEIDPEGMAWIETGISSPVEFNALKKNGIQVYPISAKQYVGGAWVEKTAKTYKDGEWVPWIKMFAFNLDITKWATVSGKNFSNSFKNNEDGSLTFATSKNTAVSNEYAGKYYCEPVDLTDYDKLVLDLVYTLHSGNAKCEIYFSTTPTGSAAAKFDTGFSSASGEKTLNVSQLTGEYYLVLLLYAGSNGQSTLQINSAKLTEGL